MNRNIKHIATKISLSLLLMFSIGCNQNEDSNLNFVELTVVADVTAETNSTPIKESISPSRLQKTLLRNIAELRKITAEDVTPLFYVQYMKEDTSYMDLMLGFVKNSGEEPALILIHNGNWIQAAGGDWSNQREWLQEDFYSLEKCKRLLNGK